MRAVMSAVVAIAVAVPVFALDGGSDDRDRTRRDLEEYNQDQSITMSTDAFRSEAGAIGWPAHEGVEEYETYDRRRGADDRDRVRRSRDRARFHQTSLEGRVVATKTVTERRTGAENLVVMLRTEQGTRAIVDLGPADRARVRVGDRISVSGSAGRVGKRPVLFARGFDVTSRGERVRGEPRPGGQRFRSTTLEGRVLDTRKVTERRTGQKNLVALVRTTSGSRAFVDLGPAEKARVRSGDRLSVSGTAARVGNRPVLFARQVEILDRGGRTDGTTGSRSFEDDRSRLDRRSETADRTRIEGEILEVRTYPVQGTSMRHAVVVVDTGRGPVLAMIGPTNRFRRSELAEGSSIRLVGTLDRMPHHTVLVADAVRAGGRTVWVDRAAYRR